MFKKLGKSRKTVNTLSFSPFFFKTTRRKTKGQSERGQSLNANRKHPCERATKRGEPLTTAGAFFGRGVFLVCARLLFFAVQLTTRTAKRRYAANKRANRVIYPRVEAFDTGRGVVFLLYRPKKARGRPAKETTAKAYGIKEMNERRKVKQKGRGRKA